MRDTLNATAESGAKKNHVVKRDLDTSERLLIAYAIKKGQLTNDQKTDLVNCIKQIPAKAIKLSYFRNVFNTHGVEYTRRSHVRLKRVMYNHFTKAKAVNGIRINIKTFKAKPLNCELWFNLRSGLK